MSKLTIYLIVINSFSFIIYAIDKFLAIHKKERISEFSLLFISVIGGVIGSILSMIIFNHKTRKLKFYINNIISIIIWLIIILN